eukprot:7861463-Heterocapsa_arctica.AAC.1
MRWAYSFSLEDDKMCPQMIQDPRRAYSTTLKEIQDRSRRRLFGSSKIQEAPAERIEGRKSELGDLGPGCAEKEETS